GAEFGAEADRAEVIHHAHIEFEFDALAEGGPLHPVELQLDDLANLRLIQRMKDDDLVDPVDELWPEMAAQHLHQFGFLLGLVELTAAAFREVALDDVRTEVRGGDDDGVSEVHHA